MNRFFFVFCELAFFLMAVGASAQQAAGPVELPQLSTGAVVAFIPAADGWSVEIKGSDAPALSQSKPAWIEDLPFRTRYPADECRL